MQKRKIIPRYPPRVMYKAYMITGPDHLNIGTVAQYEAFEFQLKKFGEINFPVLPISEDNYRWAIANAPDKVKELIKNYSQQGAKTK